MFKVKMNTMMRDPKTGWRIQDERALNTGSGPHRGVMKLLDNGQRPRVVATINESGIITKVY